LTRGAPDWFKPHQTSDFPIPSTEEGVTGSEANTASFETVDLIDEVLDDSYATFARRIFTSVVASEEIFNDFKEDVYFNLYVGNVLRWSEPICGGIWQPTKLLAASEIWGLARMAQFDMIKIPANTKLKVSAITYGMPTALTLTSSVWYITEVDV